MTSKTSASDRCMPDDPAAHNARHIHEFGDVPRLVHVESSEASIDEDMQPVAPAANSPVARHERWRRLARRLYRPRHLMQYFYNDTLYRTKGIRRVSSEELFLDLVIVAAIASLGHELRAEPVSWPGVEKFILLFAAIYSSWRHSVILWNLWGVHEDMLEKTGIYLTFVALVGVALGAHGAFDDGVRPYVAVSAFMATAVPSIGGLYWAWRERLLKNPANRVNQLYLTGASILFAILPYLAAAFVGTSRAARALFWASLALQIAAHYLPHILYKYIHRNVVNFTSLAVSIELMVEKFEVLTMIVLGETVIGILFEGGAVVTTEGVRVGLLYLAAIAATAILYSLQTLYVQVDSPIQRGGKHAIRHNAYAGLCWSIFHMPYHFFLILFATGLGISVRDIALPGETVRMLVRVGDEVASGVAQFDDNARWLFSVGWGGSMICSALIAAFHVPGPRAATKLVRIALRCVLSVAVMVGMPFADVSAGVFVGVFALVTAVVSVVEFTFVQMDKIGFFRSEATMFSSTDSGGEGGIMAFDFTESESDTEELDLESGDAKLPGESNGPACTDDCYVALKERLCKGHCSTLFPVKKREAPRGGNNT